MNKNVLDNPLLAGIEKLEPYPFTSAAHLHDLEPPPMLIDDILPAGGIMGITSFPGVGKSWLCMEVIRAVSTDTPFLGHFATLPGSVLFVGSDSSEFDYARQWTRLSASDERAFSVHASEISDDTRELQLSTENGPDWRIGPFHAARFLLQSDFMLDNLDSVRRLISTCLKFEYGPFEDNYNDLEEFEGNSRRNGFRVIIFDTLSKLCRANQNDNTEMEEVFRNLRLIAEATGAAIILLHHNAKKSEHNEGSDWRGAMSQIGALDSWIQLSTSPLSKSHIKVEFKKFRGITPANFAYKMYVSDERTASLEYFMDEQPIKNDGLAIDIMKYLTDRAPRVQTIARIADALAEQWLDKFTNNMANLRKAINGRLDRLSHETHDGFFLYSQGGGKRGKQKLYWVTKREIKNEAEEPEELDSNNES